MAPVEVSFFSSVPTKINEDTAATMVGVSLFTEVRETSFNTGLVAFSSSEKEYIVLSFETAKMTGPPSATLTHLAVLGKECNSVCVVPSVVS